MPVTDQDLLLALQAALSPSFIQVLDESAQHAGHAGANGLGRGTHFRIRIQSSRFAGLRRVAQHRLVYDALQKFIELGVHALAIEVLAQAPHPAEQ